MENKKDIGKAISDKLDSLDKEPREQVWSGISYELQKKKKRRTAFFFFWGKITGLLLIGALAAFYIYEQNNGFDFKDSKDSKDSVIINGINGETITINPNTNSNDKKTEVGINNNVATDGKNANEIRNSINKNSNASGKNSYEKEDAVNSESRNRANRTSETTNFNTISSKASKSEANSQSKVKSKKSEKSWAQKSKRKSGGKAKKENEKLGTDAIAAKLRNTNDTPSENMPNVDLTTLQNKNAIEKTAELKTKKRDSLIAQKRKEKEININMYPKDSVKTDSAKTYRKFYVDAFVSPTINGYFSGSSTLDRDFDSLSKKSEMKFSYGFGITYDLSDRLSVRIGYRKINISYVTEDASFLGSETQIQNFGGIDYLPNVSNQTVFDAANFNPGGAAKTDIIQKISYTEIPLEIKYLFLDKTFGLKSSFGFSYLLLNDNTVSFNTNSGYSQEVGKTKDLSATSVSLNFGLEVDYPIFRNTKVFVAPIFNYQVKAFSDSNYKPYIFGIHTGIRYSFNN